MTRLRRAAATVGRRLGPGLGARPASVRPPLRTASPAVAASRAYQTRAPGASASAAATRQALAQANPLRQAFARMRGGGGTAPARPAASLGMWQMLPGANVSRALARTPGIDWVLVDCEHGHIDDAAMHEAVPVIAAEGVSPIVRIPDFQSWMVKRALDSGAHGIVAPLIRSVDEVKAFVSACKFPPQGTRGCGSPLAMQGFRLPPAAAAPPPPLDRLDSPRRHHPVALPSFTEYRDHANASVLTLVQIETREALENVEAIAPLVDALFVGPFDLANSLGHPIPDSGVFPPAVTHAMARVQAAAAQAASGCVCGVYAATPEQARDYAAAGFHMVNVATDVLTLQAAAAAAVRVARS